MSSSTDNITTANVPSLFRNLVLFVELMRRIVIGNEEVNVHARKSGMLVIVFPLRIAASILSPVFNVSHIVRPLGIRLY